jgi:Reverse transcriptase (RNA-dependent DNA polymerase)
MTTQDTHTADPMCPQSGPSIRHLESDIELADATTNMLDLSQTSTLSQDNFGSLDQHDSQSSVDLPVLHVHTQTQAMRHLDNQAPSFSHSLADNALHAATHSHLPHVPTPLTTSTPAQPTPLANPLVTAPAASAAPAPLSSPLRDPVMRIDGTTTPSRPTIAITSAQTPSKYRSENGLTSTAEALFARIRENVGCLKCVPESRTKGSMILDSAGTGDLKIRRFRCKACKCTYGVKEFLAVYSGQPGATRPTAQDGQRASPRAARPRTTARASSPTTSVAHSQMDHVPSPTSHTISVALLQRDAFQATSASKPTPATHSPAPALLEDNLATHQATPPAHDWQQATRIHLGGYTIPRPTQPSRIGTHIQVGARAETSAPTADIYDPEKRKATIEATLDKLGLHGINRKKRRLALEVLTPIGTPSAEMMTRVALNCGRVEPAMAVEAVRSLKIDPRLIHHIMITDAGVELLVALADAPIIVAKATAHNLVLGAPKATVPDTRKECDALLKTAMAGARAAKHPNARAYFDQWVATIKANLPRHVRANPQARPIAPLGIPTEPELPDIPIGEYYDPADVGNELPGEPEAPQPPAAGPSASIINVISSWIVCSVPKSLDMATESILDGNGHTHATINPPATWVRIEYVNVRGLSNHKLNILSGLLKPYTILFVAETWHIDDARQSKNPCVMAISPEVYRSPVSRGKGGLMLLAHETIRHACRVSAVVEFAITVAVGDITIAGIYLPPSMSNCTVRSTLEALPDNITLVLGDLNAKIGSNTNSAEAGRYETITKWCTTKRLVLARPDTKIDCSEIDHILVRQERSVKDNQVIEAPIRTDHPLITVQILMGAPITRKKTPRFNIHKLKGEEKIAPFIAAAEALALKVREAFTDLSRPRNGFTGEDLVGFLDNQLLCLVQTVLVYSVGIHVPSGMYTQGGSLKSKPLDMATAIRTIRSAQRENNAKCELESKDKSLYPHEEAERHYTAIYKSLTTRPRESWQAQSDPSPELVTVQEVAKAIKDYPSGKSPGLDGIDRRVLHILTGAPIFMICLTLLYNTCITAGLTPRRWNTSVIAPIPKQGRDPKWICNRRPVALSSLFRRVFEKLILPRIVEAVALNRGQAGFRTGFSCATQVLLAEQARANGQSIRVFLDLTCAYDSVPTDKMLVKLANKGIAKYLVKLVESLLTNCSTVIAVNGSLTREIMLEKGLFQGSLLSPQLFDVFIDDMAEAINDNNVSKVPECLLFADDILLNCNMEYRMKHLIDVVEVWCQTNEMSVNVPKSGTTHTGTIFYVKGAPLPVVPTYRYLGIPLSKGGIEPKGLIEENIRRATGALALVKNSLASKLWSPAMKINIYKMFIRSVLEYAAPILVLLQEMRLNEKLIKRGIKDMQKLQNDAVKWAFCKKRPLATLESLAGLSTIDLRFKELTARFSLSLLGAPEHNPIHYWINTIFATGIVYMATIYPLPPDRKVSTIEALYRTKSYVEAASKNRMAGYIDSAARLDTGMDACLFIQNKVTMNLAIQWRCNTYGCYLKCKLCNLPFTRRHAGCVQFPIGRALMAEYTLELSMCEHTGMYSILDFLLNKRHYALFAKCINTLSANLVKGSALTL